MSNSPHSKGKTSSISKRLFADDNDDFIPFSYNSLKIESFDKSDHILESEELEDVDEFDQDERRPLEKLLMKRGKN